MNEYEVHKRKVFEDLSLAHESLLKKLSTTHDKRQKLSAINDFILTPVNCTGNWHYLFRDITTKAGRDYVSVFPSDRLKTPFWKVDSEGNVYVGKKYYYNLVTTDPLEKVCMEV